MVFLNQQRVTLPCSFVRRLAGQACLVVVGVLLLVLAVGISPGTVFGEDPPARITPADVGHLKDGKLILCPKQSYTMDLSNQVSGRFTATASSSNTDVVSSRVFTDRADREHLKVTFQAGENNGEQDLTAVVTITVNKEKLNAGFPEAPPAGKKGYGVHGSGENNGPHSIEPTETLTRTGTVTVTVLTQKKCADLERQRQAQMAVKPGAKTVAPKGRSLKLCVRGNRVYTPENELKTLAGYEYRRKPQDNPQPIRGLVIQSNSNPDKVGADTSAKLNEAGNGLTSDPIKLRFSGLAVGASTIVVQESPLPVNVRPFSETYNVTVEACADDKITTTALPEGYITVEFSFPERIADEDIFKDEFEDTQEESAQEPEPSQEHSALPRDHQKSAELITVATIIDETPVTVNCPSDAQAGDMISCSVMTDSPEDLEKLKDHKLQIGSMLFAMGQPLIQVLISDFPAEGKPMMGIQTPTGELIGKTPFPIHAKTASPLMGSPKPSDYLFPRTCHKGSPVVFKGPFQAPVEHTAVTVENTSARILAKSPRTLVVENPATSVGPKVVRLKSGPIMVEGPIENLDPATMTRLATPTQQAIQNVCHQTMDLYRQNIKSMVDNGWKPPRPPHHGTWEALLRYDLTKNLTIQNITVMKSSGYSALDQSAVERVHQLQGQFRPLPSCFNQASMEIEHAFKVIYH